MLLHKWCPFLMRMMSPLVVGLIWFFLIGVSSSPSSHHVRNFQDNHSTPSSENSEIYLKHTINPSAKDHASHETTISTKAPRTVSIRPSSSRPLFPKGSDKSNGTKSKIIPNVSVSFKLKVGNVNEKNSTVVYLPRYSRAMVNFSSTSSKDNLKPIIVSSHRRDLLDPNEYKFRSDLDPKHTPKTDISPHFRSHSKRDNFAKSRKGIKFPDSLLKNNRTNSFQPSRNLFRADIPNDQPVSESTAFIKIKSDIGNGADKKKSYSISQPSMPLKLRNQSIKFLPRKHRRGRNFDISEKSSSKEESETNLGFKTLQTKSNKTNIDLKVNIEMPQKMANYSNHSPNFQRSSLFFNDNLPSQEFKETIISTLIPELGSSYTDKKAKNLTIYEILKPRLKINQSTDFDEEFSEIDGSLNYTLFSLNSHFVNQENKENYDSSFSNLSTNDIPNSEKVDNVTLVTNAIEYEPSEYANSMVILPARSDSSYAIEYVMVNRSNSVIVSPSETNETHSSKSLEFGKRNSNNTNAETTSVVIKPVSDRDNIHNEEEVIDKLGNRPAIEIMRKSVIENENENIYTNKSSTVTYPTTEETSFTDDSDYITLLYESDSIRQAKMSETIEPDKVSSKNPKIDSKMFYDYFAKKPIGNVTIRDFPYPEFRPGNMFRYSDIYQRKPVMDVSYSRPTPSYKFARTDEDLVTQESILTPTTFNSLRTSVRVLSTFYPNRMQDVTLKFGNRIESTTHPSHSTYDKRPESRNDDDPDDAEYRDAIDPGFTMEKLAYLLIGTCCGLSILCLIVVVIAIKCRRAIVEKRIKAQFRNRMYHHERMKGMVTPWQQQMFDHFMYLHRRPVDSSCSSGTDSCNCRCVTWSLGARNLDSTRPLCPTNRSSLYLCGQKKLPFGAASTLRFESMLGHKRSSPDVNQQKTESPNTDSSHENDSLDLDSDSREGDGPKQCTCIDYNVWPMAPSNVPRGFFAICPNPGRYNVGNCSQHPPVELRTLPKDIPPPVTGSNYLDRSEGVVYWSSNDERLI